MSRVHLQYSIIYSKHIVNKFESMKHIISAMHFHNYAENIINNLNWYTCVEPKEHLK